jgi:hypothetical protein
MKVQYTVSNKLQFEIEGEGQKEIFKGLASVQEIFGEEKCGVCGNTNYRFVVRNVDDNDYYELRCNNNDCGATLAFGQHKKGGTLFPRRKDDEGKWLSNKGWHKWQKDESAGQSDSKAKKK